MIKKNTFKKTEEIVETLKKSSGEGIVVPVEMPVTMAENGSADAPAAEDAIGNVRTSVVAGIDTNPDLQRGGVKRKSGRPTGKKDAQKRQAKTCFICKSKTCSGTGARMRCPKYQEWLDAQASGEAQLT